MNRYISLEEVGVKVQIPAWLLPVFFFFDRFLPFGFLLFILPADPVSFARFLRKRSLAISNIKVKRLLTRGSIYIEQLS